MVNIDSLVALIPSLLQKYILLYCFSQDHHELLFYAERRAGGWNNIPTVGQFRAAFRHLISRCGVKTGETGNVIGQDSTDFVGVVSSREKSQPTLSEPELAAPFDESSIVDLHDFPGDSTSLTHLMCVLVLERIPTISTD
ncbi:hypothetical protein UPYG_G00072680 [Umbra pygmaea]|uniref:Transposable element P transposase-like RNase H C-terminal domain-containing protein n=1 Tax=Umbra pygmaea TaxID=75934 RepID=A0ABD0XRP0_UMBPY